MTASFACQSVGFRRSPVPGYGIVVDGEEVTEFVSEAQLRAAIEEIDAHKAKRGKR